MSDAPGSLAAALAQLQARLPRVTKSTEGQAGTRKIMYADLPDVTEALLPLLAEAGLIWTCCPTLALFNGELKFVLDYRLEHVATGDARSGQYPIASGTPQQMGGAITYARRYALQAVTGLAPDDGGDADAAEYAGRAAQLPSDYDMRMPNSSQIVPTRSGPSQDVPPEERPGSVTRQQHVLIARVLNAAGIEGDDASRAECARRIGQPVQSRGQLSWVQAKAIIEWKEPAGAQP